MSQNHPKKSRLLGPFLKEKRQKANLSQKDVADGLGYTSAQFISNWERGLSSPPLETLKQLAEILNIKPRDIINIILKETKLELEQNFHKNSVKSKSKIAK